MPTPTDLVTDLPADFEVFGQAVDTSMADLKGGTTGQILSKATNTDMDFTWITNDVGDITAVNVTAPITGGGTSGAVTIGVSAASTAAAGVVQLSDSTSTTSSVLASTPTATKSAYDLANAAIPKSTVTTAGDIIFRNGSAPTRLGIGTAGQVLAVNSGATAPEWITAGASAFTKIVSNSFSGVSSVSLPNGTFTSTYRNYKVIIIIPTWSAASAALQGRYRASGTDNSSGIYSSAVTTIRVSSGALSSATVNAGTSFNMGFGSTYNPGPFAQDWTFCSPQTTDEKQIMGTGFGWNAEGDTWCADWFGGHANNSSQFDSFTFYPTTGTFSGTYYVYGLAN
jgi:hypothetical protein